MGLIFIDGFDHYGTSQIVDKWNVKTGSPTIQAAGRWGGGNLYHYWTYNTIKYFHKNKAPTIYLGFAFKPVSAFDNPLNSNPLIRFYDEAGASQVSIHGDASNLLRAYQGSAMTELYGTADTPYPIATWVYIEIKVTVDNAAGIVQIKMNEQTILNATGLDTKVGTDFIGRIALWGGYYQKYVNYDDLYINDQNFYGNCRVRTFMPDADSGTHTDFVRSGGAADYECVDEQPSNEDTDYIAATALAAKSAFGITSGAVGVIKGLQLISHLKATTSGIRRIKPLVRSGGADHKRPVSGVIPADYIFKNGIYQTDPQDSQPWDQSKLEAAEFGVELVGGSTTTTTSTSTTSTTTS